MICLSTFFQPLESGAVDKIVVDEAHLAVLSRPWAPWGETSALRMPGNRRRVMILSGITHDLPHNATLLGEAQIGPNPQQASTLGLAELQSDWHDACKNNNQPEDGAKPTVS